MTRLPIVLTCYFVVNLILAIYTHLSTKASTSIRPRRGELIVFSAFMILLGLPIILIRINIHLIGIFARRTFANR